MEIQGFYPRKYHRRSYWFQFDYGTQRRKRGIFLQTETEHTDTVLVWPLIKSDLSAQYARYW